MPGGGEIVPSGQVLPLGNGPIAECNYIIAHSSWPKPKEVRLPGQGPPLVDDRGRAAYRRHEQRLGRIVDQVGPSVSRKGAVSKEFTYFLFGSLFSIPAGILATFLYNYLGKWNAHRSASKAARRIRNLRKELAETQRYAESSGALTHALLARLILINVIWIAQSAVWSVFSMISNGIYASYTLDPGVSLQIDLDVVANIMNTIGDVVSVVMLYISLRLGLNGYQLWQRVSKFSTYQTRIEGEIGQLNEVVANSTRTGRPDGAPPAVAAAGGESPG